MTGFLAVVGVSPIIFFRLRGWVSPYENASL